jgi:hypothetical protein
VMLFGGEAKNARSSKPHTQLKVTRFNPNERG